MTAISRSSATTAGSYCAFVILTLVCIFDFWAPASRLPVNVTYGITLILLSIISLLLGFTSQDPNESVLRAFQICSAAMWGSIGVYHVTESLQPRYLTDVEALFGGYGAFLLIFILLVIGGLQHKAKFAAVLALGYALSCVFELASLWKPLRASAAAYYILLAALTLYNSAYNALQRFRTGISYTVTSDALDKNVSKDYIIVCNAMNTVAFAIFAGHVTGIYDSAHQEFHWVIVAGFFQCVCGLVAVRRSNAFNGGYFLIHGVFWLSIGYNLAVEHITFVRVYPLIAVSVILFITFLLIAVVALTKEVFQVLQNISMAIFCIAIAVDGSKGTFVGGTSWVSLLLSLYGLMAHITRMKNGSFKLPIGSRCLEADKLKMFLVEKCRCCAGCLYGKLKENGKGNALFSTSQMLGYSKYLDLDMVGFAVNAISALSILWVPKGLVVLPWVIVFGGIPQLIVGSVSFARGLTFESCAFFTFGSLWLIWGSARGLGIQETDHSVSAAAGCIGFLTVGVLLLGLAAVISMAWFVLVILFILVVISFLLNTLGVPGIEVYEVVISIAFAIVCIYCFLASVTKAITGRTVLPTGKPIVQVSYLHSEGEQAYWADARRASGVKNVAAILNQGGICGVPTDVVYVLVAALKFPKSVERAYETKKLAEDRPMSMWISKREQLEAGREEFGELLWDFMKEVWPSTISLVVKKGPWLQTLGVDFAEKYIGRPDSIAVRMPDNTVTSHLIDQTGPIAVSSANPTGEADTTHHLQVLAKLGLKNCDGILCAGPSPENAASTVVDCRKIEEGKLGFFRIGIVPRSRVEELFEKVQRRHKAKADIPASISHRSDNSSDSGVCGSDKKIGTDDDQSVDDVDGGNVNEAFEDDGVELDSNAANQSFESGLDKDLSDDGGATSQHSQDAADTSHGFEDPGELTEILTSLSNPEESQSDIYMVNSPRTSSSPEGQGSAADNSNEHVSQISGGRLLQAAHEIGGRPSPTLSNKSETKVNPIYQEDDINKNNNTTG
ncbi:uncharacterized protein LOC126818585 [Patella vulgata]|uniref:uncharacterized protein LOC126818585 n=1 Tax=Patella vulgata TaxID=6465 RepID=UPI00217FD3FE|nr:uncharacterized protein LOC126818585 [Patella vulgata]